MDTKKVDGDDCIHNKGGMWLKDWLVGVGLVRLWEKNVTNQTNHQYMGFHAFWKWVV
jgi:hypothetical protein